MGFYLLSYTENEKMAKLSHISLEYYHPRYFTWSETIFGLYARGGGLLKPGGTGRRVLYLAYPISIIVNIDMIMKMKKTMKTKRTVPAR